MEDRDRRIHKHLRPTLTNIDPVSKQVEGKDRHLRLPSGFRTHAVALGHLYSWVHTVERELSLNPGEMELAT